MSSVYVICWIFLQTFQTYFCIQANSVDPDQTSLIWVHTVKMALFHCLLIAVMFGFRQHDIKVLCCRKEVCLWDVIGWLLTLSAI